MKMRTIILLFLAISVSLAADYTFLMIPGVSSASLSVNPTSSQGIIASGVGATQNFPKNITITGSLKISGNNTVSFAGLSPSLPVRVYLNGSIDIVDNGTLVLKYATLYLVGAKKPYDRYIRLSNSTNGHPRLIILDSVIDAYTSASFVVSHTGRRTVTATASYGCAIYAYNNSEISAQHLSFYRELVYAQNYSAGGLTIIKCYGESSVNLTSVAVDSVFTYDEAQVSIYTGNGPKRITGTSSPDAGISIECHNTSIVNLYGVTFNRIATSEGAHLLLTHSKELSNGIITTKDRSRLDCLGGTTLTSTVNTPALSSSGNSYVSLSSSQISSSFGLNPAVTLNDNATFAIVEDGTVSGKILAVGHSIVVLNNTNGSNGLANIGIEGHNSSRVSIFNSTLLSPLFPVGISLFDGSSLSLVNSTMAGGWINFFDNSAVYASHSILRSSSVPGGYGMRIVCQDNANVTFVASQITANTLEIKGNARLVMDSSFASLIYCGNSSQFLLVNGEVTELDVSDSPRVLVMNSTLAQFSLVYSNVTGSLTGLTSFCKNSTFALSGSNFEVSVLNTTISGLSLVFSGHSNVTISNSTIRNLSLLGSSVVRLNDTSVHGSVYSVGNSRVLIYSPLRVRCLDYFGNPLNGSVVTIETGYVGAPKEQQTADKNGLVSFVLFSEMENATGSFPFGVVTVSGSFGGVSTSRDISVSSINKDVTLSFPLPSWSVYLLPVVVFVVIVALLVLTYYVLKRVRGKKE